ncbi:AzlD domain-containing protein [Umezawaea sp. Da 62-37]|uniref:AzlD domain-containing protein n=1 Tax=Umezawaea sp. Da 62-37 TaxID=3075927 RepID=UPI0028F720C1|nr:AzlD domain-containing protein [Umezawaea sp. Da 62-37]WNV85518.1 AzlD domain-containing protein [Umezawaea sp. Da 62-37]
MSPVWWVVVVLGAVTVVIKAVGPVALGGWTPSDRAGRVLALVSPVVLAALIAVQVFTTGQQFQVDARLVGLGAAVVALLLRAPLLVVVVCAVAATGVARLLVG